MELFNGHWQKEDFKQIMSSKEWKEILLKRGYQIIFRGNVRILKARSLGSGVVEVYKMDIDKSDKIIFGKTFKSH